MRTLGRLSICVVAAFVFACGQSAFAQPGSFSGPAYAPGGMGDMGAIPGYGGNSHSPVSPMLPYQMEPWPRVSPYEHAFSQHANENGLWFHNVFGSGGQGARPFLRLDFLQTTTRSQQGIVGNNNVVTYYQEHYDDLVAAIGQVGADDFGLFNYFDPLSASEIGDMDGNGIRARTGFWFASGSGLLAEFSWQDEATATYNARKRDIVRAGFSEERLSGGVGGTIETNPFGPPFFEPDSPNPFRGVTANDIALLFFDTVFSGVPNLDPPLNNIPGGELDNIVIDQLRSLRGIPVFDGSFGGVTLPYDLDFIVRTTSELLGSNVNFATSPFYQRNNVTLRTVWGGRYMYLREGLLFRGIDSGAIYDDQAIPRANFKLVAPADGVDQNGDGFIDNPPDNGVAITVLPISQGLADSFGSTVRASLDSEASSHLAGPEAGIMYEIGDAGGFRITGHSKVALLFNREEVKVSGDNIGLGTQVADPADPAVGPLTALFERSIADPNPNRFSDVDDVTHLTPLFEQSFTAELPIFKHLPVLNRMALFEEANVRAGFTFIVADEIASPNQSVLWQGSPQAGLFPEVDIQRDTWWTYNWSLGFEWTY